MHSLSRVRRLVAAASLAAVVAAGIAVHLLLPDSAATDITGDALYAVAAYAGIVLLAPRAGRPVVAVAAAAWCVGVELLQLTGWPLQWGLVFPPVVLLLGTAFDARDLAVYVLAVVTAALIDSSLTRRRLPSER
jgi:hypothetical protein